MKTPEEIALEVVEKMRTFRYQIHTHECDADAAASLIAQAIRAERERVLPSEEQVQNKASESAFGPFGEVYLKAFFDCYQWLRARIEGKDET